MLGYNEHHDTMRSYDPSNFQNPEKTDGCKKKRVTLEKKVWCGGILNEYI